MPHTRPPTPPQLDAPRTPRHLQSPPTRTPLPRPIHPSPIPQPKRNPTLPPTLNQNRRLPRRLRLLPAKRPLHHRRPPRKSNECPRSPSSSRKSQDRRRHQILHGRSLARRPARPRIPIRTRNGKRRGKTKNGSLLHPRHANEGPSPRPKNRRPNRLQSQSRHLARILRRNNPHQNLRRPPENSSSSKRIRNHSLQRRHNRHGRIRRRPSRPATSTSQSRTPSRKRTHQHASPRPRHPASQSTRSRSPNHGPHDSHSKNRHAQIPSPPSSRPPTTKPRSRNSLLHSRCQLNLHRRKATNNSKSPTNRR